MDIDKLLSTLPPDVRNSPVLHGLKILVQTLQEQLQKTQEQLVKAEAKIESLEDELRRFRKLPKRPKFRPNNMEPRNRSKGKEDRAKGIPPSVSASLIQKEHSEVKILAEGVPEDSRFKGYQEFTVQELGLVVKEITYKLEV